MNRITVALNRRRFFTNCAAIGGAIGAARWSEAATGWPQKPVRVIVPYNPGGATDVVARLLGNQLASRLGQPILVENRSGAGGILGTDAAAKADPDGYTFVVSITTSLLINQYLYNRLPYDPRRDLAWVSQIALTQMILAVHPSIPARSGPELLAFVKENKGKLSYGSFGIGSPAHLCGSHMSQSQNGGMVHVAYRGEAPMLQDLLGGQIHIAFASAQVTKPHSEKGLRLIGVTGEQRLQILPELPTLSEQGMNDSAYRLAGFMGMAAPVKTPESIVRRMSKEISDICRNPEIRERLVAMGFSPVASTPESFAAAYAKDAPAWENLVKDSGAKLE